MLEEDAELLRSNPRVTCNGTLSANEIASAEAMLPRPMPELVRWWITRCGVVMIDRPAPGGPHLLLLGMSPGSGVWDDIVIFNRRDNPTLPREYLVFAREFDGAIDHVYAVDGVDTVFRTSGFLFPVSDYTDAFADTKWERAFSSPEEFWISKVRHYLTE